MICSCGAASAVKDTRQINDGKNVWRRRICIGCGAQFTTVEQLCETIPGKRGALNVRSTNAGRLVKPVTKVDVEAPHGKRRQRVLQKKLETKQKEELKPKPKPKTKPAPVVPARNRIEDMKLERELMGE